MNDSASPSLLFYTTQHCHLCEQAESLLVSVAQSLPTPIEVEAVDIAYEDASIVERYGECIPVLCRTRDAAELGWPFDAKELADFLAAI